MDDRKVRAVFSDIPLVNDGIMKKVNEQEREELIRKISAMTVGMDALTVKKLFEEVENRNNDEIDPIELAKIKQLITNMFDYNSSLPSDSGQSKSGAAGVVDTVKNAAKDIAEKATSQLANKLGSFDVSERKKEIINKIATTSFKGGNNHKRTSKRLHQRQRARKNKTHMTIQIIYVSFVITCDYLLFLITINFLININFLLFTTFFFITTTDFLLLFFII